MKIYLRTWRYGQDTTVGYHGSAFTYDHANAVLVIEDPVLDSGRGINTVVTIVSGDEFTIEQCSPDDNCDHVTLLE